MTVDEIKSIGLYGVDNNFEGKELADKLLEAIELISYFTERVEKGSIQSVTTYAKYKDFLNSLT